MVTITKWKLKNNKKIMMVMLNRNKLRKMGNRIKNNKFNNNINKGKSRNRHKHKEVNRNNSNSNRQREIIIIQGRMIKAINNLNKNKEVMYRQNSRVK